MLTDKTNKENSGYSDQSRPAEAARNYWIKQFEDEVPILQLQSDNDRPIDPSFTKDGLFEKIDTKILTGINEINRALEGNLFEALLSCLSILLYRYTTQGDLVIGSAMAVPKHEGAENEETYPVNTFALRLRFEGTETYEDLLQKSKEAVAYALENRSFTYHDLIEALSLPANTNRNPLFDVSISLHQANKEVTGKLYNGKPFSNDSFSEIAIAKPDINFAFTESENGLDLFLEYNAAIYGQEQMQRMLGHFVNIMDKVVQNPRQGLFEIDFLTEDDKQKLLKDLNNTAAEFPDDKTMVDLFEDQVKKTPGNRAVIYKDVELSYQELNSLSNRFGDYLRKTYRVKPDDLVGIKLERSEWMIIAIIGILKAGGAYVPIAPDLPQERIDYLVKDSACKVLIDEEELEKFRTSGNKYNSENQSVGLQPGHLAYCIYTSGSTGNPKGCLLQHKGLVNRLAWMQKAYPLTGNDVILQKTTFSFDVSVWELLWWAIQGAGVCMLPPGGEKSPQVIAETIEKHNVTVMHFVPSMLSVFLEYVVNDKATLTQLKTLKQVFTSGEALTLSQAERFNDLFPHTALMNLYGPTEASIDVTYFDCKKENLGNTVPIGRPIDNTQIYIVDAFRNLLPPGAAGEICLGGVGLARGYLNRPELTAERFIANPFVNGERIYRTGDLGKWRPDGNVEYLGRMDDQVKIRGYRIELGEIENALSQCELVNQAVVLAKADEEGKKHLVGYVVGKENYDREAVIDFLRSRLPDYMVPALWVEVDHIPLTANGKANKKLLPEFNVKEQIRDQYVEPRTASERVLAEIWEDVLKINRIGVTYNFFDLGGDSLSAVRIVNQIKKRTGKAIQISDFFNYNTIESLDAFLDDSNIKIILKSLVPIKPSGTKAPVYFIHGAGLNVMCFADLAMHLDKEQPVFGLQAIGLAGKSLPKTSVSEIAQTYVSEIMEQNPTGPYAIVGYSSGGFMALEIKRQLELTGREVKLLAMIDTNADHTDNFIVLLPKKLKRHISKWANFSISFLANPKKTIQDQRNINLENEPYRYDAIKLAKESGDKEYYHLLKQIRSIYNKAYENSLTTPFDDFVYLFRAKVCVHYTHDKKFLGWRKFALKGVKDYEIPGNHRTILLKPNVQEFGRILQKVLDETFNNEY